MAQIVGTSEQSNWEELAASPELRQFKKGDLFGHDLMQRRIESIQLLSNSYMQTSLERLPLADGNIYIVGVGSSRAHADYLCFLLEKFHGRIAKVIDPLTIMQNYSEESELKRDNLIVFSQGLSPNTHAAIASLNKASNGLLFTAVSAQDTNPVKSTFVQELSQHNVGIIRFPMENEYEILPRFVGPFIGYLAVYKYATESLGNDSLSQLSELDNDLLFTSAKEAGASLVNSLPFDRIRTAPIHIVATSPYHDFAFNLQEKVRECLLPASGVVLSSITGYDHGRFQHAAANNGVDIILTNIDRNHTENTLVTNRLQQSKAAGLTTVLLESPVHKDFSILWFEMAFNHWLENAVKEANINLRDWKGKELEAQGNYSISGL